MNEAVAARALWHVGPRQSELRSCAARPGPGLVGVRTLWSGISRGTERLVFEGRVPESERLRMRAPMQEGEFPFPVKYGYAAVGVVEHGPRSLVGRSVFALHPHQSFFVAPEANVTPLPDDLPPRRAILAANMETALNAVWDSGASAGDRIAVVGAGALGLLTAALLSRIPGADVTLIDLHSGPQAVAEAVGVKFTADANAVAECDLAFHTSATAAGLCTALDSLGEEGTLVEMSWHGAGETPVPLGGAFHARRLRILSSQVGALPPARRPRWTHARRMALAVRLLRDPALDALITQEVAFEDLPARLPGILAPGARGVTTAVRYA
ncbi:MAG: zinc-binding alcohol dehydrogenase [Rubrimonas sp.]|uniref:zinc-dependent alcohol dehydrogenase n=1 Tax=Rubrimonas sp. TaxID=2036015 RepID=UPI002FDE6848